MISLHDQKEIVQSLLQQEKEKYDFIFIDTSSTMNLMNQAILFAGESINIVCESLPVTFKRIKTALHTISMLFHRIKKDVPYSLIINKYMPQSPQSQKLLGRLRMEYGNRVLDSIIKQCKDIEYANNRRQPLVSFCNQKSSAIQDLIALQRELLRKST